MAVRIRHCLTDFGGSRTSPEPRDCGGQQQPTESCAKVGGRFLLRERLCGGGVCSDDPRERRSGNHTADRELPDVLDCGAARNRHVGGAVRDEQLADRGVRDDLQRGGGPVAVRIRDVVLRDHGAADSGSAASHASQLQIQRLTIELAAGEYESEGQDVHVALPVVLLYVPLAHAVQAPADPVHPGSHKAFCVQVLLKTRPASALLVDRINNNVA